MKKNAWLTADKVLVIGHRGASADAPENTLASFRLAREQGADGIEFDVRLAADGVPVVIHDPQLERTTNAVGAVSALSSSELQKVDAGQGEPVPTLDAVFTEMGTDFIYNVEIKADPDRVQVCVLAVLESIDRHQLRSQVCISSFEHNIMQQVQMLTPRQIVLGMLRAPHSPAHPDWFRGEAVHPHFMLVNADYLAWARDLGCKVNTWTVDSAEVAQLLQQLRVNSIMTNQPAHIIAALAK
ncbi:MAG TPA: hypothetical protein ENJ56_02305 [Anaerolineae bacterium]|nr:hypothetical protein [Anaerolineae bacterium]